MSRVFEKKVSHKKFYLLEGVFLIGWLVYLKIFRDVYQDATDFVTSGAKLEIQLLEMFNYRGQEILSILVYFFILVTLNLLLISTSHFKEKASETKVVSKFIKVVLIITSLLILASSFNKLWLIMSIVTVFSLVINYIIFTMVNNKIRYEDQDLIEDKGPFEYEEEAVEYAETILTKKVNYFKKYHFSLLYNIYTVNEKYFVELYIEKNNIHSS